MISARDFVLKRKSFRNFPDEKSLVIHLKSVTHEKVPEKKKFVRGETIIFGVLLREISSEPIKTAIHMIAHMDIKGNIPVSLINKVMEGKQEYIISNLTKGCELVRSMNK